MTADLELLRQDHQKIMRLISEMAETSERPTIDVVEDYFVHLRPLLSLHLKREDETVYRLLMANPTLMPTVERARQDHLDIERLLSKLGRMTPDQRGWTDTVHDVRARLARHIAHEEHELFPLVEAGRAAAGVRPDLHPS